MISIISYYGYQETIPLLPGKGACFLKTIRYHAFVEAVRCGSLTTAAQRLNYTQPGISHIISTLEQEVGFPLLLRSKQGVVPTENGQRIYDILAQVVQLEEQLNSTVAQFNGVIIGTLRVGGYFSVITKWMPSIIEQFAQRYPLVELQMLEGETEEQMEMMEENRIDAAIFTGPPPKGCIAVPIHIDPAVIVLPAGHELAQKELVSAEELCRYPLLMQNPYSMEEMFSGFPPDCTPTPSKYSFQSDSAIISAVQRGLGIGVTSELLATPARTGTVIRYFEDPYPRTLNVVVSRQKLELPVVKCFISVLCELYQDPQFARSMDRSILKL